MKDQFQTSGDSAGQVQDQQEDTPPLRSLCLRVLATTDLHMQFLGFDYVADAPLPHHGLAGIATLVKDARAEAAAQGVTCLLLDNGDLLQGAALGETLTRQEVTADHPVVRCLAALGYDAMGLGNHDLDHGLPYLEQIARHCRVPWITTNLIHTAPGPFRRGIILEAEGTDTDTGQPLRLRIGLLSALPEQTAIWNRQNLKDRARVIPAGAAVAEGADVLRRQGAEIVILLAHFGIGDSPGDVDARSLAALPGIDAVIAGHSHLRLPGRDHAGYRNVDVTLGTLRGRPAVMPGFDGSDLGILDLKLGQQRDGNWRILHHATRLQRNGQDIAPDPALSAICAPAHRQTRDRLARPVGQIARPLHNYFSLAAPTMTCAIVASAKRQVVQEGLAGHEDAELPILAAASAHTAGGRGGPSNFLHVPAGQILRRHLAGLNPYVNEICALKVTGRDLRAWLEHSAQVYSRLAPGSPDQPLLLAHKPAFDFDTIFGLDYVIDPRQPPGCRISDLRHAGAPVGAEQPFILATNQFRAAGGGGGARFDETHMVFQANLALSEAVERIIQRPVDDLWPTLLPWQFCPGTAVQTILRSAPHAQAHLGEIAHLSPEPLGVQEDGFLHIRLTL